MPRTVIASFRNEADAEQALAAATSQVALLDSAVVSAGLAGSFTLDSLNLSAEDRAACEAKLQPGAFLLVAQAANDGAAEALLGVLQGGAGSGGAQILPGPASGAESPRSDQAPQSDQGSQGAPTSQAATPPPAAEASQTIAASGWKDSSSEERIPIVEEELRIGKREVLRGGARVRSFTTETPVQEQVELVEETASVERRPVNRRLSEEEVVQGGLLQARVVEVSQMREEAVVTKEAFVREELVVTKNIEHRVEQINETLRRTEVQTETLRPQEAQPQERSAFAGAGEDRPR